MLHRISRFNYWNFVDINPILRQQFDERNFDLNEFRSMFDKDDSLRYEKSYKSGNVDALFEYARINPFFLRQRWVQDKVQMWILWPDENSRKWTNRLLF